MMGDNEVREKIINELVLIIEQKGKEIQGSNIPIGEQLVQVDVLIDTIRFLDKYVENTKVLNQYWRAKRDTERFGSER